MKMIIQILIILSFTISGFASAQMPSDSLWRDIQKIHLTKADSAIKLVYKRLNTIVKPGDYSNMSQAHHWLGTLPQGLYVLQVFDAKGGLVKAEKVVKE